jgi:hypothetical protein
MPGFTENETRLWSELWHLMEKAIREGHDLQAAWIAYALMENRLTIVLELSGGVPSDAVRSFGRKLGHAQKRLAADRRLQAAASGWGPPHLDLAAVDRWKDERNDLTHDMAQSTASWGTIGPRAAALAREGIELARTVNSFALAVRHQHP